MNNNCRMPLINWSRYLENGRCCNILRNVNTRSEGPTKVILQGTVECSRRRGKPKRAWLTTSRSAQANLSLRLRHGTQPAGVDRTDEEVHHDAPLRLLAELSDQAKARQGKARQGKARQGKARQGKYMHAMHDNTGVNCEMLGTIKCRTVKETINANMKVS